MISFYFSYICYSSIATYLNLTDKCTEELSDMFLQRCKEYGEFLFGLVIGLLFAYVFARLWGYRSIKKSYELLLSEKDKRIKELGLIVIERFNATDVEKLDAVFFKKIKRYFKNLCRK